MKKIYIALGWESYVGSDNLGVYSTKEKAEAFVKKYEKKAKLDKANGIYDLNVYDWYEVLELDIDKAIKIK